MASDAEKALNGDYVFIEGAIIRVPKDMNMTFNGLSCNIEDANEVLLFSVRKDEVKDHPVDAGSVCIVLRAFVQFVPRSVAS